MRGGALSSRFSLYLQHSSFLPPCALPPLRMTSPGRSRRRPAIYSALTTGQQITGTYTINYGAANQVSCGLPGSASWDYQSIGGAGIPPGSVAPAALVFSSTATVGTGVNAVHYATYGPSSWYTESYVQGGGSGIGSFSHRYLDQGPHHWPSRYQSFVSGSNGSELLIAGRRLIEQC
jgi:hypothetical protein